MNQLPEQTIIEHIRELEEETIVWLRGKSFVIRPASPNDVERITKGIMWG